ncbi:hypothetical protein BU23DRAFT_601451 [Bimuria novae-zelandiae CBS 107.79]|uniref:Uncharacterized protein n=1 Tax=Bimuria novae-zelandiae CBS 107.79 TaxID=1447943 RepID=A0A6A5V0W3_9PLEO|nr:hypothetical protein BU23DRAFT_601451 [Bimuria novae-zelandiae CBS 107.79]
MAHLATTNPFASLGTDAGQPSASNKPPKSEKRKARKSGVTLESESAPSDTSSFEMHSTEEEEEEEEEARMARRSLRRPNVPEETEQDVEAGQSGMAMSDQDMPMDVIATTTLDTEAPKESLSEQMPEQPSVKNTDIEQSEKKKRRRKKTKAQRKAAQVARDGASEPDAVTEPDIIVEPDVVTEPDVLAEPDAVLEHEEVPKHDEALDPDADPEPDVQLPWTQAWRIPVAIVGMFVPSLLVWGMVALGLV